MQFDFLASCFFLNLDWSLFFFFWLCEEAQGFYLWSQCLALSWPGGIIISESGILSLALFLPFQVPLTWEHCYISSYLIDPIKYPPVTTLYIFVLWWSTALFLAWFQFADLIFSFIQPNNSSFGMFFILDMLFFIPAFFCFIVLMSLYILLSISFPLHWMYHYVILLLFWSFLSFFYLGTHSFSIIVCFLVFFPYLLKTHYEFQKWLCVLL